MIYLTTDYITAGLQPCRAIFHFYPVKGNIKIPSTAEYTRGLFTILRDTSYIFAGLTMAPQGLIFKWIFFFQSRTTNFFFCVAMIQDGSKGNFAGQIIGRTYQWANPDNGTDILDYRDAGDASCQRNSICYSVPSNHSISATTTTSLTMTASTTFTIKPKSTEITTTTTLAELKKETVFVTHTVQLWETKTTDITQTINITDVTNVTLTFTSYTYLTDTTTTTFGIKRLSSLFVQVN